jgi:hypothetical protein
VYPGCVILAVSLWNEGVARVHAGVTMASETRGWHLKQGNGT